MLLKLVPLYFLKYYFNDEVFFTVFPLSWNFPFIHAQGFQKIVLISKLYLEKQKENEDHGCRWGVDSAGSPVSVDAADEMVDAKKEAENINIKKIQAREGPTNLW